MRNEAMGRGLDANQDVETGGRRLPLVRGSFQVDQQAKLDASECEVPKTNV